MGKRPEVARIRVGLDGPEGLELKSMRVLVVCECVNGAECEREKACYSF